MPNIVRRYSYVQSQSENIQSHFEQGFADYVRASDPMRADAILSNTSSQNIAAIREEYAKSFLSQYAGQIERNYDGDARAINPIDTNQFYETGLKDIHKNDIGVSYNKNTHAIESQAGEINSSFSNKVNSIEKQVTFQQNVVSNEIHQQRNALLKEEQTRKTGAEENMKDERQRAEKSVSKYVFTAPGANPF